MFWNLLDEAATTDTPATSYGMYIVLGLIVVLLIFFWLSSGRKNKQRQKEYIEQLAALGPGNKVKTAGGICGIVVEVCDDNTVIIETGSEQSGKSYIKMDKELIAQTDAKGPTQLAREEAEALKKQKSAKHDSAEELPAPAEEPAKEQEPENGETESK